MKKIITVLLILISTVAVSQKYSRPITTGNIPYKTQSVMANSPLTTDGTNVTFGAYGILGTSGLILNGSDSLVDANTIFDYVAASAMVYPDAGIALSTGSAWGTSITNNSTNWNTAYSDRLDWDGGTDNLVAATARTSLGGTTIGQNVFTSTNPSAITFARANADNTFSWLNASDFRTAIGAGDMDDLIDDTSPQLGGDLDLNDKNIDYSAALGSDSTWVGDIETITVGEDVDFGQVLYRKFSDGKWWLADQDTYIETPAVRMALEDADADASCLVLIKGQVRDDTWDFDTERIYLGSGGAATKTVPSGTGTFVQLLGTAITADKLDFNPSTDVGEI